MGRRSNSSKPQGAYPRLTQPLVRDNGVLRPATWDEALDRAADGFRRNLARTADGDGNFQLLEVDQRGQLPGVEIRPSRCSATTTSIAATGPDTLPSVVGLTTILGAGGSTSSYEEAEHTDFVFLWGSNAREAHPIWFHHLLKGIQNGATLYVVDPRRTEIRGVGRRVARAERRTPTSRSPTRWRARSFMPGLHDTNFIERGRRRTSRRIARPSSRTRSTSASRRLAFRRRSFATRRISTPRADRAMICWTLGITEHHNAVDNVAVADQSRAAHRPRRPLRLRVQSAARTEQRARRR